MTVNVTKIREKLGSQARTCLGCQGTGTVREDLQSTERDAVVRLSGFAAMSHHE